MSKSIQLNELTLGVCYYPEHWPEALWEDDFRRMREMNISVIRMAEFAWAMLEPDEGRFDFSFFQRVLDLAHRYGLKVIMGTPTATPPAWLTHKYPEVLNANVEGVMYRHGMRRHYNYSSPVYRELCGRIVRNMAEAYKDHPAVIGWQIDNELNCEINVFYAEADHIAFREWLKARYGSLDRLNQAWGTVFWSQTYTDWEQVYLTRPLVSGSPNPHLALDEKRFISANTISFVKLQADIIRELAPQHWITTNGMFGHLDNHELTDQMLDFFSYDSYPQFSTISPGDDEQPLKDRSWSMNLSNVRSVSPNFCIMEQQSGPGGWVDRIGMGSPRPGQLRLWTYQSVLHGADLLLYFRWRTATFGTEIYWHGINDYHNRPNRRVREVAQVGGEFAKIGAAIAGTKFQAEVAILQDYDNLWDGELDEWHGPLNWQSKLSWFKQLQYRHIPADFVMLRPGTVLADLTPYKVIVYPHAAIMTDETADLLSRYVEQGGQLFFGARTGYKNPDGHCKMDPFPGPVAGLCGITVEDFTLIKGSVAPAELKSEVLALPAGAAAPGFNEVLATQDEVTEVMAEYASEYYAGSPALTRRAYGKGYAWYLGAAFSEQVAGALIEKLGLTSPAADLVTAPAEVELGVRAADGKQYLFALNYSDKPSLVYVNQAAKDLLTDARLEREVEMPPYGVLVLEILNP
ncbi:beta-galactosidase [Paenibacillus sp. HN-1]|uniref:beta-galactosidase n=1 Tax=Paenibacillus TaxID=44249 RepID=UPI001CA8B061|nr:MULTISPECIES: beta-galactosidase [Paenibacillus]MBY9078109.1 beta-galactosidase [Paenibacillus sp. CGMCC 1.18879]MBY9083850.1 beta-galactosidase [Paenibacillus sinensis]